MNRAERRRAAREAAADGRFARPGPATEQKITLLNPVSDHFESFIVGNATICQRIPPHPGPMCPARPGGQLADPDCSRMAQQDSAAGQRLILCGAGPSLADAAAEWCPQGDQVWGCNSAATWLYGQGHKVTHGFTVDQTPHMVAEWSDPPPLEYLLATSCHPHLAELLSAKGRRFTWFHNYVGVKGKPVEYGVCTTCGAVVNQPAALPLPDAGGEPTCPHTHIERRRESYEDWLYMALYPPTVRAGSGLNSVNRAIDVALFLGFREIVVLGADCALRVSKPCPPDAPPGSPAHRRWLQECTVMHADGGHAMASGASMMTMDGVIDGRTWTSKPDMLVSAVWLVKQARAYPGRIRLVGDTLPVALQDKPNDFLLRLPTMVDSTGRPMPLPELGDPLPGT